MEIFLVRHGRPQFDGPSRIRGRELGIWTREYDAAGIDHALPAPASLRSMAEDCGCVVTSPALRAVESTRLLGVSNARIEPDFVEACLPEAIPLPFRLRPGVHTVVARALWWLTWCDSRESIASTRERADRMSDTLCELADAHGRVLAIGHGMFNRFVATCLRKRGWRGPRLLPSGYWSSAVFIKP